jgi:hypothetical protein
VALINKASLRQADAVDLLFADLELAESDLRPAREAAEVLIDSLWREEGLKEEGLQLIFDQQRRAVERLAAIESDRRANPTIANEKIVRPIILAGAPRSGTTFLHSLMSHDPSFRSPLAWETIYPSPPPVAETWDNDPRIEQWNRDNYIGDSLNPHRAGNAEFAKKHLMAANLPEECGKMMSSSVRNMDAWAMARVASYFNWFLFADKGPAFVVHRKWLQHLQWRNAREHWLLKYPSHGYMWEAVFNEYPDAVVIETHRNPAATVSSLASLIGTLRRAAFDRVDPIALGIEMLHYQQFNYLRPIEFRRNNPDKVFVDLSYKDLLRDPMTAIEKVYTAAGLTLSAEAERRMRQFIADTPQGKHGVHEHDLVSVGLSDDVLRERLAPYYEKYAHLLA